MAPFWFAHLKMEALCYVIPKELPFLHVARCKRESERIPFQFVNTRESQTDQGDTAKKLHSRIVQIIW